MALEEHLHKLKQGKGSWNHWMNINWQDLPQREFRSKKEVLERKAKGSPHMRADLSGTNFEEYIEFKDYNFYKVDFSNSSFRGVRFINCIFKLSNLSKCDLRESSFARCDMELAKFLHANLNNARFKDCCLNETNLSSANLYSSRFNNTPLLNSRLLWAQIINTKFTNSPISGSRIYGASVWNTELLNSDQTDLIITNRDEIEISADNLEVAQFLYLMISNRKFKQIVETLTSKVVLILGRFTFDRKLVLTSLKQELTKLNYVPVIFDFQKPDSMDFIEPVLFIADMAKFVIADFSEPKVILEEVPAIAARNSAIILPLLLNGQREPTTLLSLKLKYPATVSNTFFYQDIPDLLSQLATILKQGNKMSVELNARRDEIFTSN